MNGEKPAEKGIKLAPKNISEPFYKLTSYHKGIRFSAAQKLLTGLKQSKDGLKYSLERLIKGSASPRECARLGFSVALTELLKSEEISCNDVFTLMDQHLPTKGAGDNTKNNVIGQMLCLTSLIRSKKCMKDLDKTIDKLNSLISDRPYLEMAWAHAITSLSLLTDEESFRSIIFPAVKTRCNSNFDNCTPVDLWIILELDKLHQKYIRKKAKIFRDGHWPPSEQKDWAKLGDILAASSRATPSGIHPLEKSVLASMIAGDQFEAFWNETVCGYLLKHDNKLAVSVGIRMIGNALGMQPSKKQLKSIFSTESVESLLKALIDRRQAARFSRSVAQNQLDAIQDYVFSNKANAAIQFLVLKKILDLSLKFDSVSGSGLINRLIGGLSTEAASLTTDYLIGRLKGENSDSMTAVRLLHRVFECSKSMYQAANEYRLKILRVLLEAALIKSDSTDLPESIWQGQNGEVVKNIFMRCLDELSIISLSKLPNRPKFEFPAESLSIMSELLDLVIDRKQGRIKDECKATLKPDQTTLVVKAAKIFHHLVKAMKAEGGRESDKGFGILIGYTLFWFLSESEAYRRSFEDLLICYEESKENQSGSHWKDVLIDLLLDMLSRPHRHLRAPIQVAFHYFCPLFNSDNIQPLLKALKPSQTDALMVEGEEEDEDEQDGNVDAEKTNGEDVEPWSSSDESEVDQNEEGGEEPDDEFRRAVEDALGDAAMHSDTESTASDLPDETMLKLDKSLAEVFRSHLTGAIAKKSARDLAEQAQAFRVRCFDLLFVLLHSQPSPDVLTGIPLPILHVANEAVRMSDQKNVFNRARQAIERVVQIKLPSVSEESSSGVLSKLANLIKEILEFTRNDCTNPSVQSLASDSIRYCLKFGDGISNEKKDELFDGLVREAVGKNLQEYLTDRQCVTPTCVFTAAFQRRPHLFLENLPKLMDAAFSENVRPFRRHEACGLIGCLLSNKNELSCVKEKSDKKITSAWKHFVDGLHDGVLTMISQAEAGKSDEKASESTKTKEMEPSTVTKPGDFFEIFAILRTLANLRDAVPLRKLTEEDFLEKLENVKAESKLGQMTGRLGQKQKKLKLSSLCAEIVKKIGAESIDVEEEEPGKDGKRKNEDAPVEKDRNEETPSKKKKRKNKEEQNENGDHGKTGV